ncbi:MAG TPA: IS5 family transposase [Nitrososphaeraceae archaeon]|nr:IS5 family transposase [Nitrososphaeraceae archaeon]
MPLHKSWHDYNESLIERGRILMDVGFIKSWNKEVRNMNEGKVGAPFEYSHSYIHFLAFLKIGFKIAYRTVQGIVRGLSDYIRIEEMHFTHIRRRILKIKPPVVNLGDDDDHKPVTLIVDASGLTVSNKGDYIEEKWIREKKEFIKLHIAVDEKSEKVVSFRITKGSVHDTKQFGPLVKESAKKHDIDKVYGDKAYDNRKNFNILDDINAEPAINIRKNASSRSKGCPLRRDEVLLIKKLGYERWKQLKNTGRRWIAEIVFSSLKRVLSENLLSKKFKAQKVEAGLKVMLYNKFISL